MDITGIDYLGLDRVLKRGSGEIIAEQDDALLIRDSVSGACMLACEDTEIAVSLLDRYLGSDDSLLLVTSESVGKTAFERYGFADKLVCCQVAYYGEWPADDGALSIRTADESDLPMLVKNYGLISPDELATAVGRRSILLGYDGDRPVGFIGEHLEGSMGLLYVFPEYRRRGFGAALQRALIAKTMDEGFIPFGQVEKDNLPSFRLQEKLGMTRSEKRLVWMWK